MICPHCGSKTIFVPDKRGWLCEGCHRLFTGKEKKSKTAPPFDLHEAYVSSLANEVEELKRDVKDLIQNRKITRCPNCDRLYDEANSCPYCGNSARKL